MESIRPGLGDQFRRHLVFILCPPMLRSQLLQSLSSSKSGNEPRLSATEVILGFIEGLLRFQDLEDRVLPPENILCVQKLGKLLDRQIRLRSFFCQQLRTLRRCRSEVLDPRRSHDQSLIKTLPIAQGLVTFSGIIHCTFTGSNAFIYSPSRCGI